MNENQEGAGKAATVLTEARLREIVREEIAAAKRVSWLSAPWGLGGEMVHASAPDGFYPTILSAQPLSSDQPDAERR